MFDGLFLAVNAWMAGEGWAAGAVVGGMGLYSLLRPLLDG